MPVYVVGHRNPDTDAICSAIAYADLLRQTTIPNAEARACGAPNLRTEFALNRAGLEPPKFLLDARPTARNMCSRDLVTAGENDVFYEVYEKLRRHEVRTIPVLNAEGRLSGILSLIDLLDTVLLGADQEHRTTRQVDTTLNSICKVLGGTFAHVVHPDDRQKLTVMVGAMGAEGFTKRLHDYQAEELLVVSGNRPTIQLPALERGVRAIVVTGGYELSPGLLQLARANHVTVIDSPHDTATTTLLIRSARRIEPAIQRDFVRLSPNMNLEEVRRAMERTSQTLFPVATEKKKLIGVISKSDLINPTRTQLILVDHNELSQAVHGAADAEILEVLDHHRLGGELRTPQPIRFVNVPVGSTCTLVAGIFQSKGVTPSPQIALCMAAGIISDTLNLKSPTATQIDRDTLDWLRQYCEVDLESFAAEFFAIGSTLRSCEPATVVREDCKEFTEHGIHFSISQIEEIGFDRFWSRTDELRGALEGLRAERGLSFSCLLVTDIQTSGSVLLVAGEPRIWEGIPYPQLDDDLFQLDGVVSRKKQFLPMLLHLVDGLHENRPI